MRHIPNQYDALLVLGAVMRWDPTTQQWTFPLIMREDEYIGQLVLGEWRARAAALLHTSAPLILVTGGSNIHPETSERCSRAQELARRIIELGVPSEKVQPIGTLEASNTHGNVDNFVAFLREHPDIESVGVLAPRFQEVRAMTMLLAHHAIQDRGTRLTAIQVERELLKAGQLTIAEVDAVYRSPEAEACRILERAGMQALFDPLR